MSSPATMTGHRLLARSRAAWRPLMLGVALLVGGAASASAQQRPPDQGRSQDRARLEERIRQRMGDIIRERLGLDQQQEEALSALVQEYEARRRALTVEERRARARLEDLADSDEPVSDEEAEALLRQVADVRLREAALLEEEQDRLLEILSASQVLELYELRRQIGQRIRAIREGRRGDGRGRRGPPRGGAPDGPGASWLLER